MPARLREKPSPALALDKVNNSGSLSWKISSRTVAGTPGVNLEVNGRNDTRVVYISHHPSKPTLRANYSSLLSPHKPQRCFHFGAVLGGLKITLTTVCPEHVQGAIASRIQQVFRGIWPLSGLQISASHLPAWLRLATQGEQRGICFWRISILLREISQYEECSCFTAVF